MDQEPSAAAKPNARAPIVRDLLVFQGKLVIDGFRDLLLVPVSLLVGIVSIIGKRGKPGDEFYELLRAGRRSERWINLFGAVEEREPARAETAGGSRAGTADLDALISRVETFLVDEYRNGGVTAQAKARLDAALESLHGVRDRRGRDKSV